MSGQHIPGANPEAPSFTDLRDRIQADIFAGMPAHLDRLMWSASRLRDRQRDRLRATLAAAKGGSPFHARRLAGVDPSRFELADLQDLPVMTKAEMMAQFDDVITHRRLTREAAERALAATAGMTPRVLPGGYMCIATGGSSGQRGIFAFDAASAAEFCSLIFRNRFAATAARWSADTDGQPVPSLNVAMVGAPSAVHGTVWVASMFEGSPIRFSHVPVTWQLPAIVGRLNQLQPEAMYGYPSMLARLAAEQRAGRLRIAPQMVSSTAETLLPEFRAAITAAFEVPVGNTFATSEGLTGASPADDPVITMATDSCVVELVDEAWRPVTPGTPSARVLVTNLYNHVQPLIRYELTDSFTRQPNSPEHGHLRAIVEGRCDEILHYADVDVHPLALRSVLLTRRDVVDYQIRQTTTGVDVWVLLERHLDLNSLRDDLRVALQRAGVADPEVHVEAVTSLPRHPETGKLRRVIPV
jgi:phenylacetate-coenzyme A ligase PaaK-like adenylate-forming protein